MTLPSSPARPTRRRRSALVLAAVLVGATAAPASAETPDPRFWPTEQTRAIVGHYDPLVGDFDGDGFDDVYWYAAGTARDSLWLGGGGSLMGTFSGAAQVQQVNGTYQASVGDFAGDEAEDIYWNSSGAGPDSLWIGGVGRTRPAAFRTVRSLPGRAVVLPSTTGKDALAWIDDRAGQVRFEFPVGSGTAATTHLYLAGATAVVGDFDGNGLSDLFGYAPGAGIDQVLSWVDGGAFSQQLLSVSGTYAPVAADLDGDGRDDLFFQSAGAALREGARTTAPVWRGRADRDFGRTFWTTTFGSPLPVRNLRPTGPDAVVVTNVLETTVIESGLAWTTPNERLVHGQVLVGRFTDGVHEDALVYRWDSRPALSQLLVAPPRT